MKKYMISILAVVLTLVTLAWPIPLLASPASDACEGIKLAGGTCDSGGADGDVKKLVQVIVNTLSIIVGAASVIMIIVGGFRYVISGGDSNGVSGAKNTIMYAIIGLVVVIFAQVIVAFVYSNATTSGGGSGGAEKTSTPKEDASNTQKKNWVV